MHLSANNTHNVGIRDITSASGGRRGVQVGVPRFHIFMRYLPDQFVLRFEIDFLLLLLLLKHYLKKVNLQRNMPV